MKTKHLLFLVSIVALCSCSSAFRTGQTPDDVYYSPAPPPPVEYVTTENQQDRDSYAYNNSDNSEDLAIRRGIRDQRYRSNMSLDLGYGGYSQYDYFGSSLYSPFSSYSPYTSYYNPYYNSYSYTGVTFFPHGYNYDYYGSYSPFNNYYNYYYPPVYSSGPVGNYSTGPRTFNLGAYNSRANNNTSANRQQQSSTGTTMPVRTIAPRASNGSGVGNFIRRVITPSNNNNRSYSNDNDSRSYRNDNNNNNNNSSSRNFQSNTSSGSSSSSSSSGSSSAPVRTFK